VGCPGTPRPRPVVPTTTRGEPVPSSRWDPRTTGTPGWGCGVGEVDGGGDPQVVGEGDGADRGAGPDPVDPRRRSGRSRSPSRALSGESTRALALAVRSAYGGSCPRHEPREVSPAAPRMVSRPGFALFTRSALQAAPSRSPATPSRCRRALRWRTATGSWSARPPAPARPWWGSSRYIHRAAAPAARARAWSQRPGNGAFPAVAAATTPGHGDRREPPAGARARAADAGAGSRARDLPATRACDARSMLGFGVVVAHRPRCCRGACRVKRSASPSVSGRFTTRPAVSPITVYRQSEPADNVTDPGVRVSRQRRGSGSVEGPRVFRPER